MKQVIKSTATPAFTHNSISWVFWVEGGNKSHATVYNQSVHTSIIFLLHVAISWVESIEFKIEDLHFLRNPMQGQSSVIAVNNEKRTSGFSSDRWP